MLLQIYTHHLLNISDYCELKETASFALSPLVIGQVIGRSECRWFICRLAPLLINEWINSFCCQVCAETSGTRQDAVHRCVQPLLSYFLSSYQRITVTGFHFLPASQQPAKKPPVGGLVSDSAVTVLGQSQSCWRRSQFSFSENLSHSHCNSIFLQKSHLGGASQDSAKEI